MKQFDEGCNLADTTGRRSLHRSSPGEPAGFRSASQSYILNVQN